MHKLIGMVLAVFLGLAGMVLAADIPANIPTEKQKVVYHINSGDAKEQLGALRNIQNHISAAGADSLDIKVVLHGDGLSLLLYPDALAKTKMMTANSTEEMQVKVEGLKQQNVQFQVCNNTIKGRNIPLDGLYGVSEVDVVPSGVAQLAILQSQGYAYIKP
ncbi:MAG: DsrE family protein [Gammaproteobacteria bacterium]|nr:DsrE family protein [Gammaproteobacteria bacterium]